MQKQHQLYRIKIRILIQHDYLVLIKQLKVEILQQKQELLKKILFVQVL
jgi:hypothetical protein